MMIEVCTARHPHRRIGIALQEGYQADSTFSLGHYVCSACFRASNSCRSGQFHCKNSSISDCFHLTAPFMRTGAGIFPALQYLWTERLLQFRIRPTSVARNNFSSVACVITISLAFHSK
jgi:hypothetical protein